MDCQHVLYGLHKCFLTQWHVMWWKMVAQYQKTRLLLSSVFGSNCEQLFGIKNISQELACILLINIWRDGSILQQKLILIMKDHLIISSVKCLTMSDFIKENYQVICEPICISGPTTEYLMNCHSFQ